MVFSASRALPLVTPNITSVPGATIAFAPHTRTKYAHCPVTAAPSLPSVSVNTLSGTVALATTWTLLSMFPSAARVLPPPCFNSFSFRVACTAVALLQRRACCGGSRGWYKKISFFPPSASQKSSTFFLNGRSFVSASGSGIPNASAICGCGQGKGREGSQYVARVFGCGVRGKGKARLKDDATKPINRVVLDKRDGRPWYGRPWAAVTAPASASPCPSQHVPCPRCIPFCHMPPPWRSSRVTT